MATRKKPQPDLTKVAPLPHDQENRVPRKPPIDQQVNDVLEKTTKGMPKEPDTATGRSLVSYKDRMAALVATTKKAEAPAGGFLSTKGSRLSIGDVRLPGDMIRAIIVDYRKDNEFYPVAYDPTSKGSVPVCFAVVRPNEILTPWRQAKPDEDTRGLVVDERTQLVSDAAEPQVAAGHGCDSCGMLEWGSAKLIKGNRGSGKGKACRETRRLHLFAADQCTTPDDVARAPYMTLIPPPTSLGNFKRVANEASTVLGVPIFGVVVDIEVKPHDDYMFMVHYKIVEQIKDEGILLALLNRHEQIAMKPIVMPKASDGEAAKAARGAGNGKF